MMIPPKAFKLKVLPVMVDPPKVGGYELRPQLALFAIKQPSTIEAPLLVLRVMPLPPLEALRQRRISLSVPEKMNPSPVLPKLSQSSARPEIKVIPHV